MNVIIVDINNLYERLEPSIRENLLADVKRYPLTIGQLIDKLKKNVAITELTFGEISTLSGYSNKFIEKINEVYDMFNKN